ncbi:hypothetical protein IMZ48_40515, partial [Candidatus Bathyarchaeota archaeon]|nr:hypothetical protein [Candidatus Bathyarchaeota archaeon]
MLFRVPQAITASSYLDTTLQEHTRLANMKLLTPLVFFLFALPALSQDADNCNTDDPARNGADFTLTAKPDNPNVASLAAIFADA